MMPTHHLPDDWLMSHASGSLSEGMHMLVAAHCTLCPDCRRKMRGFEAAGGALLGGGEPSAMSPTGLEAVLAKLGAQDPAAPAAAQPEVRALARMLPAPVRRVMGPFEDLKWSFVMPGIREIVLPVMHEKMPVRLYSLAGGMTIPLHTHVGMERTMVLHGAYTDEDGRFERGDVGIRDGSRDHDQRIVAGDACIALIVSDGRMVPRTFLGKVVTWLTGA